MRHRPLRVAQGKSLNKICILYLQVHVEGVVDLSYLLTYPLYVNICRDNEQTFTPIFTLLQTHSHPLPYPTTTYVVQCEMASLA